MGKEIIALIRKKLKEHFNYANNDEELSDDKFDVTCVLMTDTPGIKGRRNRKYRIQILYQTDESDFKTANTYVMDELAHLFESIIIDGQILKSPKLTAVQKDKGVIFWADYECEFENLKEKAVKMKDLDIEVEPH